MISANGTHGVEISGGFAVFNQVQGNLIGLASDGQTALPNGQNGVYIFTAPDNIVGATSDPSERNIISGNLNAGVQITGYQISQPTSVGNVVRGNYIGTNAAGTGAVANRLGGVLIESAAQDNLIGGTTPLAHNLISGNSQAGVEISDQGTLNNAVTGNDIGTDASGESAVPNDIGVLLENSSTSLIGGTDPGAGNLISGNVSVGIQIDGGPGAKDNVIVGNTIGTDAAGVAPVGNGVGVFLDDVPGNVVGGTNPASRNVISGNVTAGVYIYGPDATGNQVLGNVVGPDPTGTSVIERPGTTVQQRRQNVGILVNGAIENAIGGALPGAATWCPTTWSGSS